MDDKTKQDIALFRIAVLGPLVGARLEHGDVPDLCRKAAEEKWQLSPCRPAGLEQHPWCQQQAD